MSANNVGWSSVVGTSQSVIASSPVVAGDRAIQDLQDFLPGSHSADGSPKMFVRYNWGWICLRPV
jgi:hypothetical protein